MKSQASYLSYILLAGIVIGLASAAILWGQPLLTKNKIRSEVDLLENKVLELAKALEDAITKEVTVDFTGVNGYISASNGIIIITYPIQKNFIYSPNIKDLPLNVVNYTNFAIEGVEPGCVVNLTVTENEIIYKIGCRVVKDPVTGKCYKIFVKDFPAVPLNNERILIRKVNEKISTYPNCSVLTTYYMELSVT